MSRTHLLATSFGGRLPRFDDAVLNRIRNLIRLELLVIFDRQNETRYTKVLRWFLLALVVTRESPPPRKEPTTTLVTPVGTPEAEAELNAGADGKEAEDEARDADIDAPPACARARPKKLASLTGNTEVGCIFRDSYRKTPMKPRTVVPTWNCGAMPT